MTSNYYCCVPQCKSWAKKDAEKGLSFHIFPPETGPQVHLETKIGKELVSRRKAWILKLRIGKPITKFMKVCSLHFRQEDYLNRGESTRRGRILKKTAVPSQNLPTSTVIPKPSQKTESMRAKRLAKRKRNQDSSETDTST